MFNRLALYFIFSPSRTHPSSFFSIFLPHTHSHTLPKDSFIPPAFFSLSGKEMGLNFLSFPHIWRGALDTGAVAEWRRESCCDALLNVSESAEWQPFEVKHFNDAFALADRGTAEKNEKEKSRRVQEFGQILLWCHKAAAYYLWPFFSEQSFHSGRLEMKSLATFLRPAPLHTATVPVIM